MSQPNLNRFVFLNIRKVQIWPSKSLLCNVHCPMTHDQCPMSNIQCSMSNDQSPILRPLYSSQNPLNSSLTLRQLLLVISSFITQHDDTRIIQGCFLAIILNMTICFYDYVGVKFNMYPYLICNCQYRLIHNMFNLVHKRHHLLADQRYDCSVYWRSRGSESNTSRCCSRNIHPYLLCIFCLFTNYCLDLQENQGIQK